MQLNLSLHGAFKANLSNGTPIATSGMKAMAVLALLATSPDGQRSRRWLQEMLWSRSGSELGRASLRQVIRSLKDSFGSHFDSIFDVNRDRIGLKPASYMLVTSADDGTFLETVFVDEPPFETWKQAHHVGRENLRNAKSGDLQTLLPSVLVVCPDSIGSFSLSSELSDALAHQMTRVLSRTNLFFVISHLSSRTLNPRTLTLEEVRTKFSASYVVTGQLRQINDSLRLDIELTESRTARILQTCGFDCPTMRFASEMQSYVNDICGQISKSIISRSVELSNQPDLMDVESHALMMSALIQMNKMSKANFMAAKELLDELVPRRPRQAEFEAWLAQWYLLNVSQGWSADPKSDKALSRAWAEKALEVNPANPVAQCIHANIQNLLFWNFSDAKAEFQDALETDPNLAFGWITKSMLEAFTDNGAAAVKNAKRARELSPIDPRVDFFQSLTATAYLANRDYEKALHFSSLSLARNRFHPSTQRVQAIAFERLGRRTEAIQAVAKLMSLDPNFTVEKYRRTHPAAQFRTGQDWAGALSSAGAPIN